MRSQRRQRYNSKTHEEVLELSRKLKEAYKDEELFWKQKIGPLDMQKDRNMKFYHVLTKQRRIKNKIVELQQR